MDRARDTPQAVSATCRGGEGSVPRVRGTSPSSHPSECVAMLERDMLEEEIRVVQVERVHPLWHDTEHVDIEPQICELVLVGMPCSVCATLPIVSCAVLFVWRRLQCLQPSLGRLHICH